MINALLHRTNINITLITTHVFANFYTTPKIDNKSVTIWRQSCTFRSKNKPTITNKSAIIRVISTLIFVYIISKIHRDNVQIRQISVNLLFLYFYILYSIWRRISDIVLLRLISFIWTDRKISKWGIVSKILLSW